MKKRLSANEEYEVDVLWRLNGLSAEDVTKRAKDIEVQESGVRFRVMSPVDCLISRLENLRTIHEKRNDSGVWQARMAVRVARSHISEVLDKGEEKIAIRAATDILNAALQPMGLNAFKTYDIDALEAIPIEKYQTKAFVTQQWEISVKRIRNARKLSH